MDMEILRERLTRFSFTGDSFAVAGRQSEQCRIWCSSMSGDGTWNDIVYRCDHLKDWQAVNHLARLLLLAQAWHDDSSQLRGDPALLKTILRGLDAWYRLDPQNPNWWWMEIGGPQRLADVLLRITGHCDFSYIARAVPAFERHQPASRLTGQNMVWVAMIEVCHGVLINNPQLIRAGLRLIQRETRIMAREEGLQPDMSFFQHGLLLYSGGYGQCFANDLCRVLWIINGTSFQWPNQQEKIDLMSRYILDGSRWMVRGRTFDYSAIGREISRHSHNADLLFRGARLLADINPGKRDELAALAESPSSAGATVVGNRMFWCADYMTHHRPGYSATIRVPGNKVLNVDSACCGGEGRVCHHMAEGATFFYRDGDEYRDIFPVWNWRQIPGTTVEQYETPFDPEKLRGFGENPFGGGVSDGDIGAIAADFKRGTLSARKSWFCLDGGIVALGSSITSAARVPVRTTIDQCHPRGQLRYDGKTLSQGATALTAGRELEHNRLVVTLLAKTAGSVTLADACGAWSDCGVGSDAPLTMPTLNIAIDHGIAPANAGYAYTLQPASPTTAGWRAKLAILRHDADGHALWHDDEAAGMAILFAPGEVRFPDGQTIALDRPGALIYRPDGHRALIWLADPSREANATTLTLRGLRDAAVTTSLPVREYAGSTIALAIGR